MIDIIMKLFELALIAICFIVCTALVILITNPIGRVLGISPDGWLLPIIQLVLGFILCINIPTILKK